MWCQPSCETVRIYCIQGCYGCLWRIWFQCHTSSHEVYYWSCVVTGEVIWESDVGILWWCVCLGEHHVYRTGVRVKLAEYRRMCKELEHLKDGACMLRLLLTQEHNTLWWTLGNVSPDVMAWQNVFYLWEMLVEHLPLCGWLCSDWLHQAVGKCNRMGWSSW